MCVRELIGELITMPPDAKVFIDCSVEYPDCGEITKCEVWGDKEDREDLGYSWKHPEEEDVFLS